MDLHYKGPVMWNYNSFFVVIFKELLNKQSLFILLSGFIV